ncbi:TetR/AcrR family transcriptional regulator [Algoriphagus aestuariicola]|uniref:TetR/AcrR family transcriptional regulator n=1 Tax=Algoriphagus aestuariicola TaxID=1852016 RepID=A0ABS3BT32_9BACT|nr:TetR/AcrR family transcriptional regulator [Algoriphagus aestuariicola]MBN7800834.1 TetR/AcrR family transcriptional regulator [Algoriphagus aestuariicola]
MGIADRKERDKEELREKILVAAKSLFLEKGVEKTSIRNIADQIEYSPGIIYHYFRDKNEIFHALHQGGFSQMMEKMQVLRSVRNPMERLKAMGSIYVGFALENPDMYDLMFIKEAPIDHVYNSEHDNWKEGGGTFEYLRMTIKECAEQGHFKGHDLEPLTYLIWSAVHGMVSLNIRKRCEVVLPERQNTIIREGLEEFFKILDRL